MEDQQQSIQERCVFVLRNKKKEVVVTHNKAMPTDFDKLLKISINQSVRSFSFSSYFSPKSIDDENQIWQVINHNTALNHSRSIKKHILYHQLRPNQVIKFGRVYFKLHHLQRGVGQSQSNNNNNQILLSQSQQQQQQQYQQQQIQQYKLVINPWQIKKDFIKPNEQMVCRICYSEDNQCVLNPIVKVCNCQGSLEFVHIQCIKKWIQFKCEIFQTQNVTGFIYSNTRCEVCLQSYYDVIRTEDKIDHHLFDEVFNKISSRYIILEQLPICDPDSFYNKDQRMFFFLNFDYDNNNLIKLGRNRENQIRIKDQTVSRMHAVIFYDSKQNQFFLKDQQSKFGTYVLVQNKKVLIKRLRHSYKQYILNGTLFNIILTNKSNNKRISAINYPQHNS